MISKYGGYDQGTGKMNWSITINPDKKNISGYAFNDTIDNNLNIPTPIIAKGSNGTELTIDQLPYTFPEGSNETYTIEYQTDAPSTDTTVTNTGTIDKDGKTYESSYGVGVKHRDWDLTKSSTGNTVSEDGQSMINKWQSYMKLPDKKIDSVIYSDVIKNGTSTGDKEFNGEHYAILSELREEINSNIELKDATGTSISKDDLEISVKFYSDENKKNEVTDDDAHVKAFEVTVKKKDGSEFIGQSLNISSYHTTADLQGVKEGIDYYFVNKGTVQDKESESKVTYNKPKKFVKQGFGKIDGGTYDKYSSSKVSTDYISRDGKLYYRIIFTPDSNKQISVTDTLPEGTKLFKKGERADYKAVGYKDNPEDRGSPEAIYHFGDNAEWYCDGDANFTDIRKYFKYSYDETTNKITFTFEPGYNKTDGDYNSGKRQTPNGPIAIYYAVDITSDEFWKDLKNENKEYTNTLEYEGKSQEQHTEVERETQNVTKTANQIENSTKVEYSVVINPAVKDLNPKLDKVTLTDNLEYDDDKISPYLVLSSLKLYEYDANKDDHKGKLIDASRYQVQIDDATHKLTVTLPDELACVLGYEYDFDVGQAAYPTIKNTVSLEGEFSSSVDTRIDTNDSSAGVVRGKMTIYKVDSQDYSKKLPNAKFKLYKFDSTNKQWVVIKNGSSEEFVTNDKGEIVFSGSSEDKFLVANTLYKLEETEAPSGYDKDKNPHYFVIYQADQKKTKQDAKEALYQQSIPDVNLENDVSYIPNNKEVSLYVPNDSNSISVKKVWVDQENKGTSPGTNSVKVQLYRVTKRKRTYNVTLHFINNEWNSFTKTVQAAQNKPLYIETYDWNPNDVFVENNFEVTKGDNDFGTVNCTKDYVNNKKILKIQTNSITQDCDIYITAKNNAFWFAENNISITHDEPDTEITKQPERDPVTLGGSNNWSHTWNNLTSRSESGEDYYYTVEEVDAPSGYQVSCTNNDGIQEGDITVTNKKLDNYDLPDTGGFGTFGYYAIGALFITATLFAYIANIKKKGAYN